MVFVEWNTKNGCLQGGGHCLGGVEASQEEISRGNWHAYDCAQRTGRFGFKVGGILALRGIGAALGR